MTGHIRRAGLVLPTLLSLIGLAILIGLGSWQMARKAEKEELIAKIDARRSGAPIGLEAALQGGPLEAVDFQRVRVEGTWIPGKARFYYAPQPRLGPGYDVYHPLKYAQDKVVWVNRGFIPERLREQPDSWRADEGEVAITGTARLPAKPGAFTPENDVDGNIWYWRDLAGVHKSAFTAADGLEAAPVFVVAEPAQRLSDVDKAHAADGPWPKRGVSDLVVLNRHLEYALTWFGLALTLVAVYAAYAWNRLKHIR